MADPIIRARIPEDLLQLVKNEASRLETSESEIVRAALSQYFYADNAMQGPDAGFLAAKKQAMRLSHAVIAAGLDQMPEDLESAVLWADELHQRRTNK